LRAATHSHTYTDDGVGGFNTGNTQTAATSLTRKLVGIESRIDFNAAGDAFETSTAEQMYYVPGTSPDYEARVWATVIGWVSRSGSDVTVNLLLTKVHGANESRPYFVNAFVKIEQTSES
jgi:hypothetical protein